MWCSSRRWSACSEPGCLGPGDQGAHQDRRAVPGRRRFGRGGAAHRRQAEGFPGPDGHRGKQARRRRPHRHGVRQGPARGRHHDAGGEPGPVCRGAGRFLEAGLRPGRRLRAGLAHPELPVLRFGAAGFADQGREGPDRMDQEEPEPGQLRLAGRRQPAALLRPHDRQGRRRRNGALLLQRIGPAGDGLDRQPDPDRRATPTTPSRPTIRTRSASSLPPARPARSRTSRPSRSRASRRSKGWAGTPSSSRPRPRSPLSTS